MARGRSWTVRYTTRRFTWRLLISTACLGTQLLGVGTVWADESDPGRPNKFSERSSPSIQSRGATDTGGVQVEVNYRVSTQEQTFQAEQANLSSGAAGSQSSASGSSGVPVAVNAGPVRNGSVAQVRPPQSGPTSGPVRSGAPGGGTSPAPALGPRLANAETPPPAPVGPPPGWVLLAPSPNAATVEIPGYSGPLIVESPDRVWAPPESGLGSPSSPPSGGSGAPAGSQGQPVPGGTGGTTGVPATGGASGAGGPGGSGGPGSTVVIPPREIAIDILEHVPLPGASVRASPGVGLVALPAWFWVEGYDGRPFGSQRVVDVPAEIGADVPFSVVPAADPRRWPSTLSIEVRIWPTRYEWEFGDGSRLTTSSLGRPFPQESDVRHTYVRSSLGRPGGYAVRLAIEFASEFSVNGGPPQPLAATQRTYETVYGVQEIQSVLAAR